MAFEEADQLHAAVTAVSDDASANWMIIRHNE